MQRLMTMLEAGLHHRNGLIRKGSALALRAPKRWARVRMRPQELRSNPPVMANSIPKSGTHLLDQIAAGLPSRVNYGTFIASLTSSFRLRPRTQEETLALVRAITPGEIVRAHLYFDPAYAAALRDQNVVHYFIYRDPRDVVVSSCHYLRGINHWHRWHKYYQACATLEDALLLSINGLKNASGEVVLPDVAERLAPYEGWLTHSEVCAIRFEDVRGAGLSEQLERMLDFYQAHSQTPLDRRETLTRIQAAMAPEKSHTFRKGASGGWREAFTPACRKAFKTRSGDMLQRLGYEQTSDW
jgi:sulfotransferase 6B1